MSRFFTHLPGSRRSAPGLERIVLRRLPRLTWLGTLLIALPALVAHGVATPEDAWLQTLDIYTISLLVLHWTVVLTAGIAAFIVLVMKGPAYVADAYALDEHDPADDTASP